MSAETVMEKKLREYLGSLPVRARKTLLQDLQKAEIKGTINDNNLRILRILEDMGEALEEPQVSEAVLFETLYEPFADFTFTKQSEVKLSPRLMRSSQEAIHRWLKRDIFPQELLRLEKELARAIDAGSTDKVKGLQRAFLQMLQGFLAGELKRMTADRDVKRKLAAQLGGEIVLEDALDMGRILEQQAAISSLARMLPGRIEAYSDDVRMAISQAMKAFAKSLPHELPLFFTLIYHRMENREDLLRFVQAEMETDDPVRIAASRYAFCFDLVLHDIVIAVDQISANVGQVRNGHVSIDELALYIKLAKSFRSALNTTSQSDWARRFGEQVKRLSALLTAELSQLPQLLRQSLGYMRKDRGASQPDEIAKNQAVYLSKLLMESKRGSSTLALNALLPRISREAEQYVDVVSGRILDEIRSPHNHSRDVSATRLRNLAEISAILLNEEYAQVLLKSGGLLGGADRKLAQQA